MGKLGIRKKAVQRGPTRLSAVDQAKAAKDAGRCDNALELLRSALRARGPQAEVAKYELALLLSQLGRHEEADGWLRQLGLTWKLNPSVLDGSCLTGSKCQGKANYVAAFDNALPSQLLHLLQDAFKAGATFWKEHKYPTASFFSYNEPLTADAAVGVPLIRAAASFVEKLAITSFPSIFGSSGRDQKVSSVEWWAHSRPSGSGSGHQLHYDLDELSLPSLQEGSLPHHPLVSCVVYLSGGSSSTASTTIVTDQTLEPGSRAKRAWLCEPKVNRVLLFDGGLLHGVIPNLAAEGDESPEPRVTLMLGLWGEPGPFRSPAPSETSQLGPNMLLPATAVWPEMLKRHASDAEAVSSATAVDIAGPVQPAWCSTGASASSAPGSVEFIGRWFLNHAPEELLNLKGPQRPAA